MNDERKATCLSFIVAAFTVSSILSALLIIPS